MKLKRWLLLKLAGPLGFVVRPILAAMVGVVVAAGYEQAWVVIYKVPLLQRFAEATIDRLDPAFVQAMTPGAVGGAVALLLWGFASDWALGNLRAGNKQVQDAANQSLTTGTVRRDGLILTGGETANLIDRMAYESLYPNAPKPKPGEAEIRRPLP